jgi:hypothetical protein
MYCRAHGRSTVIDPVNVPVPAKIGSSRLDEDRGRLRSVHVMPAQKPERKDVLATAAYKYAHLQAQGDDWRQPFSHFLMNYDFGMMPAR